MNKPKGGRGHAAPYTTKLARIPTLLAEQVSNLVERYHDYINSGGNPLNPPVLLDIKPVNNLDIKPVNNLDIKLVNNLKEELETLKAETEQMRSQLAALEQKNAKLIDQLVESERLCRDLNPAQELPDYEAAQLRALAKLKLGRQAPEYKRTKKAMDLLLDELRG